MTDNYASRRWSKLKIRRMKRRAFRKAVRDLRRQGALLAGRRPRPESWR